MPAAFRKRTCATARERSSQHLGHWLSVSKQEELARRFERIGVLRFEESIPLAEVVLCYVIVKDRILEFVRGQGIGQTTVEVYAEEELEHSVGRFFDSMIYHIVCGYEAALSEAARVRPATLARHVTARG